MQKRFDRYARQDAFAVERAEELKLWQTASRETLRSLLGLHRMEPLKELRCTVRDKVTLPDGILRESILLETEENVFLTAFILIPPGKEKGVFLALPGHRGGGKYSVAGCGEIPAVREQIEFFNYDYGMKLCKLGYVAVCPDVRGFGERRDEQMQGDQPDLFMNGSCRALSNMAIPLGLPAIGLSAWDHMRLIDYLEDRGEWDLKDLGCVGFSGGGMHTLYLAALDERIRKAVISGYFYGFRDSLLLLNGNCACNYVPGLWEHFDMGDILAMYAPRPVIIQSCREDHLNGPRGLVNVTEQVEIAKQAYRILGREENLIFDIREGQHHFHDQIIYDELLTMGKKA